MISYKLYAITDRARLRSGETLTDAVLKAIRGGATIVQLREKNLPYDELKSLALSVMEVCHRYNVPFIVNDNVKLAKDIGADGVHLGIDDMSIDKARMVLGSDAIIGATARTIQQAIDAQRSGADYIGSGAVFGTNTKADARAMDISLLRDICIAVNIPVVAIGGIDSYNVSRLRDIPISGVSVVSGIFSQKNKKKASRDILSNLYGRPIVQCITNHVTVESVANMVLNFGCSPIMSHNINEVAQVQSNAAGLLLNLGATDDYDAMKLAYKQALDKNHIVVIDPVGISGISYRRDHMYELLDIGSPTCIRGNVSEIMALIDNNNVTYGLESYDNAYEDDNNIQQAVLKLAKKLNTIIVASGEKDIISDGDNITMVESGHAMQKELTGSGCMLSSAICSSLCMGRINYANIDDQELYIITDTCREIGDAARRSAEYVISKNKGIYSFKTALFDELS